MADNGITSVEGHEWKNFVFRMVRPEYHPEIFEHMRQNFYVDEPLNGNLLTYLDTNMVLLPTTSGFVCA